MEYIHLGRLFISTVTWCVFATVLPALAEEFRIESKVFSIKGKEETLASESVTLFDDGKIYDFLASPREITLFDLTRDRIVLMDGSRKLRTELTTDKLLLFTEQLRARAGRQTDAMLKFAADPKFEESSSGGWTQFASPLVTYRVKTKPIESVSMAAQYRRFSDHSARLNAMLHPGALPPFPRLAINAELAKQEARVPEQVELTLAPQNRMTGKPTVLRSEHTFEPRLLGSDRRKIDEAGESLVTFKEVPLEDYLRPVEQAKR